MKRNDLINKLIKIDYDCDIFFIKEDIYGNEIECIKIENVYYNPISETINILEHE